MSRRHRRNAKARHHGEDMPLMVEQKLVAEETAGKTYEEAKWPWLSPRFRAAHNKLRQMRGLPTIPPPVIDRYVPPPQKSRMMAWDRNDPEWLKAVQEYMRGPRGEGLMIGGVGEGFEVKSGIGDVKRDKPRGGD